MSVFFHLSSQITTFAPLCYLFSCIYFLLQRLCRVQTRLQGRQMFVTPRQHLVDSSGEWKHQKAETPQISNKILGGGRNHIERRHIVRVHPGLVPLCCPFSLSFYAHHCHVHIGACAFRQAVVLI